MGESRSDETAVEPIVLVDPGVHPRDELSISLVEAALRNAIRELELIEATSSSVIRQRLRLLPTLVTGRAGSEVGPERRRPEFPLFNACSDQTPDSQSVGENEDQANSAETDAKGRAKQRRLQIELEEIFATGLNQRALIEEQMRRRKLICDDDKVTEVSP